MTALALPHGFAPVPETAGHAAGPAALLLTRPGGPEARILLVDPEPDGARAARLLADHRFEVRVVADAAAADAALARYRPDLVILEPVLPGEDGLSLCRRLALAGGPPILILARRCEPMDRVVSLELGADDALGKDCHPLELVARVRAAIRRRRPGASEAAAQLFDPPPPATWRGWRVDLARRQLVSPEGVTSVLWPSELRMLAAFFAQPRRIFTRDDLGCLAGRGYVSGRTVDVMVCRLRRKLLAVLGLRLIISVRGVGYALEAVN